MKTTLILLLFQLLLLTVMAHAQTTVLNEDFEDRDLTTNPAWKGDLDDFSFVTEQGNTLLRLDAEPDPTRTQIITESSTSTGTWEFYIRQDFNPSNFNRAFIFLMADRDDLNYLDGSSVSGYALRTGDNGSPRTFKLVRFDGGNQSVLIESETSIEEAAGYSLRVTRNAEGEWSLFVGEGREGALVKEGETITDQTYTESAWFGLLLRYSSGNTDRFYFDDFHIENAEPFKLANAEVITACEIELTFNYPVDPGTIHPSNFHVSSLGSPERTELGTSEFRVVLSYPDMIPDGEYTLQAENVMNVYGSELTGSDEIPFSFENPFYLVSAKVTSAREIELVFSDSLDPERTDPLNFEINQTLYPSHVQIDSLNVLLEFSEDLPSGELTIKLNNIESVNRWQLPSGSTISTYRFGEASAGNVVINEFMYRRASSNHSQFVELLNVTDQPMNLAGWIIETGRGSAELPPGTVLEAENYLLLLDKPDSITTDHRAMVLDRFVALRTTGDSIVLRNSEEVSIDSLSYEPEWGGNEPGVSLERRDPLAISIDPVNWESSSAESGSTPLEENSRFHADTNPPELLFATLQPEDDTVHLRFDEYISINGDPEFFLNDLPVSVTQPERLPGNELMINNAHVEPESELMVEVNRVSDFQGNRSERMQVPVAQPLEPGDVVFNEIMFDPLRDDFDQLPNQSDYLELVNRKSYAISLEGVQIHDQPDENGSVREMTPVTSQSKWIPANGFTLLYPEDRPVEFQDSQVAIFFDLDEKLSPHTLQFERTTLSLPLSGRGIYVADSTGTLIDQVHYLPDWHNPNLIDTKGISLERIDPNGNTDDPGNWGSSTLPEGGTPGAGNSLFQVPQTMQDTNTISLEPNPFSPDDDGHEDNLFISYSFDDPNFMLRVRIYDRYGRHVRTLAESHHAGFDGSMVWDGRTDGGVTGRIGIYIVHIEAVNSSTGQKRQYKEAVVLARQF